MDGGTPLMVVAASGHVDASKLLVQLGADRKTTIPTEKGALTAAGLARASGHTYLAKALETGAW